MVSGPGQSYSRRAQCLSIRRPAHATPSGREQAPGSSTTPGMRLSLLAAALPGVAFGHFISTFGLVIHSTQTAEKGSIKSKAPSAKPRAELAPPNTQTSTCAAHHQPHRCCRLLAERPFQITQENFKGKVLLGAPEAGGSSRHSSSPPKSPRLSCFPFPTSRSSLQNAHVISKEPGHPKPRRHLQSLLQKAELVRSEPSGWHEELFHPASLQLFYPSTFKNNGAIQLFKTRVVCFFSCGSRWSCLLLPPGQE